MAYIRIDRKILEWEWWNDLNTFRLFVYMLLKANWKDGKYKGVEVPRGSFVSSYQGLSNGSGLTVRGVRTSLNHLISTGEVTVSRHPKFSVFTIKNYCLYQSSDKQTDSQPTGNRQGSDKQPTTIEEYKKEKSKNNNINTMCKADELFERLWKLYPCKKGKGQVSDTQKKRLLAIGEPVLVKAIERYSTELQKDAGWRKPQNGSTFFNSGYVDYLDGNYDPAVPRQTRKSGNFERRNYDMDDLEKKLLGE